MSKRNRRRSVSPAAEKRRRLSFMDKYRYELSAFLRDYANIEEPGDFGKFYEKYEMAQRTKQHNNINDFDRSLLLPIKFDSDVKRLYEKLPLFDRYGERLKIREEEFERFLYVVRLYHDFREKSQFARLKKLRKTQRDLPIYKHKQELLEKLERNRVILIAGDTGCGKSTQVPQYVLEAGYNKIVCTQPRRIACVSLAKRVAFETLADYDSTVGYQIRFEKTKRKETSVIFMTEGLLLRQASEEETLNSYDVIILDEIHERHLHGDFLIGIMKCLLHKRDNFKLILMSATINLELFKCYFAQENVEIVQVPGRLYPVEIRYCPIVKDPYERKRDRFDCTPYLQIIQMIDEKYSSEQKGDVLIFLNGFSEISTLASAMIEYAERKRNWIVLQLHSSLSLEEQDKVFDYPPDGVRKCIISTNIAETSVTIDGVRFVIDSGKVNRMVYNSTGAFSKLAESNISQDSAKQRAGRAGRTGPGVCFRMYSEDDLNSFEAFTPAEIHLVPLDSLILHMISLGLSDIANFPFLEKPAAKTIHESIEKLKYCGALTPERDLLTLTALGESLSNLPVDLCVGKMLIMSTVFGNVNSVLAVAALLAVQNPLTQHAYRDMEAHELRKPLESNHGDPICLLNYYKEWLTIKRERMENSRQWARKRCLEEQRFYEVTKLADQFRDILDEAGLLSKMKESGGGEQLSSGERAIRHGELKQLKRLKYELRNETKSMKRKQLKYEIYNTQEEEDTRTDVRDVDFRIANDFKRLQRLLKETSADTHKDLVLLKLILTSGLYPQVAVEDEFNSSKTVADRLFHTKTKNYVFLRPLSYFATNAEILELHNDDIEIPPSGYFSRRPISKKHQLLIYQSILETKKVYLVNVMRMPLLQTLLMFAKTIATNATLTKFVFDDFLSVDLPHFGQGKTIVLKAIELRAKWKRKLERKLADPLYTSATDREEMFYFAEDLVKFMGMEVSYNVKRLLPADLKVIYKRNIDYLENMKDGRNPFDHNYKMTLNEELGGVNVTENMVYDCLVQEDWAYTIEEQLASTPFVCLHCKQNKIGLATLFQMLQHEVFCELKQQKQPNSSSSSVIQQEQTIIISKPNSKVFHCDRCDRDLFLTPVDILKHKKCCAGKCSSTNVAGDLS